VIGVIIDARLAGNHEPLRQRGPPCLLQQDFKRSEIALALDMIRKESPTHPLCKYCAFDVLFVLIDHIDY
jgi:hypothetical protein